MPHNNRTRASPPPSIHSLEDRSNAKREKLPKRPAPHGRPPPVSTRRAVTMSPTFHIDPERSSSSENGSFSHLFYQFPPQHSPNSYPVRDSMTTTTRTVTHNSSSVYPALSISSNSYSGPPSPSSPSSSSFAPSIQTNGTGDTDDIRNNGLRFALDPDDVSGRLRLLVKNNYYLPPAHSKPSQSDLQNLAVAADAINPPTKTTPSFLDIFRVGKPAKPPPLAPPPSSRVAPHTHQPLQTRLRKAQSQGNINGRAHARRETALSVSTTSQGSSLKLTAGGPQERKGRVVVIREKMDDLFLAAKEAEVQMREAQRQERTERRSEDNEDRRGREGGGDQGQKSKKRARSTASRRSRNTSGTDEEFIVDPTDAVDLPSYSFQPQASGVAGLGLRVDASGLSAGALADQLAPSSTMSMTKEDMLWRKALLHQAVGMSMMSIPSPSTSSSSPHPERTIRSAKSSSNPSPGPFFASSPGGGVGTPGPASPSPLPPSTTNTSSAFGKNRAPGQPIVENLPRAVSAMKKHKEGDIAGPGKKKQHLTVDVGGVGVGRDRSSTVPSGGGDRLHAHSQTKSPRSPFADSSSRVGGPPSPILRSVTPLIPTEPLKPPPRTRRLESADGGGGGGGGELQKSLVQNYDARQYPAPEESSGAARRSEERTKLPMSGSDGVGQGQRRRTVRLSKEEEQERAQNRMATFPLEEGETIRKTLTKPLLSETVGEGDESSHEQQSLRSSEYFTPRSESRRSGEQSLEEQRRDPEPPVADQGRTRSGSNTTSGSEYSEDDEIVKRRESVEDQRKYSEEPASVEGKPPSSYMQVLTPRSDFFPEASGSANRPSFALSDFSRGETPGSSSHHNHSYESYSRAGSRAQGRRSSLEDSRVSMYSMAFGARGSHPQRSPTPGSVVANLPSTGSGMGLHSLDGVAEVDSAVQQERRRTTSNTRVAPRRQDTEPFTLGYGRVPVGTGSALISRRTDKTAPPQLHLDVSGSSSDMHEGGFRSAPPIERMAPFPHPTGGSFLDLEVSGWKTSDEEKDKEQPSHRHRLESLTTPSESGSRSRVSSYTGTIVPNPEKGVYAAPSNLHHHIESTAFTSFISMEHSNGSNPYLPANNPYVDVIPATDLPAKAPSVISSGPGSSFFSAFSGLKLGGKDSAGGTASGSGSRIWKRGLSKAGIASNSVGDLTRYANNPKARSTPTLSTPMTADFGRRSNVSDRQRRGGSEDGDQEWQVRDPETRKLDGMLLEHMKAEKDLIRLVAARGLGSSPHVDAAGADSR
ncbi:hypothetical protein FRB94_010417 [Tulasnella sp. JGI-2019a]|nr:hypothetical protein FRB94_010417 [Tulasnella sp. JGI-2019a]